MQKLFRLQPDFVDKAFGEHQISARSGMPLDVPVAGTRELMGYALAGLAVREPKIFWGGVIGFAFLPITLVLDILHH